MSLIAKVKSWMLAKNPFVLRRKRLMRDSLTNKTPTFFCPNCIGGILFHDLGLQFRSPTVNLMMTQTDFVKFVKNAKWYLEQEFVFFDHEEYTCPCARLHDITVHFTHYKTPEEATQKWKDRASRIDWENVFVFLTQRDGLTKEDIAFLKDVRVKGLVVFTAEHYEDIPYALHVPKYTENGEVGNILKQSYIDGGRSYERCFDFVKWFNEANGGDYDVMPFIKKR